MVITEFDAGDPEATLHALADESTARPCGCWTRAIGWAEAGASGCFPRAASGRGFEGRDANQTLGSTSCRRPAGAAGRGQPLRLCPQGRGRAPSAPRRWTTAALAGPEPGTRRGDKFPASLADQGVRQGLSASNKGLAWNWGDVLLPW